MNLAEKLQFGSAQLGITLSADAQVKLLDYLALLQKWNKVYNLTAIRNPQQMVSHHLLDSLAVMPYLWAGRWMWGVARDCRGWCWRLRSLIGNTLCWTATARKPVSCSRRLSSWV